MLTRSEGQPLLTRFGGSPDRVVLLRASRIGDFVCATPSFDAIRRGLPGAAITLIALEQVRDLAMGTGYFDEFQPFPGWPGIAEQFFRPDTALAFLRDMQDRRFDLALQMHGSGVYANPFTLLLGARRTAGFVRSGEPPVRMDPGVPFPEAGREPSRLCALVRAIGLDVTDERPRLPLGAGVTEQARSLLAGLPRPWIGLHPGSREPEKRWTPEAFAEVGAALDGTVILLGGPDERLECEAMAGRDEELLNLAGRTSLPVAAAVVRTLDLLITNDSGPAHFAYAFGTPSITLFLTTDPERWGPPPDRPQHAVLKQPLSGDVAIAARRLLRLSVESGGGIP